MDRLIKYGVTGIRNYAEQQWAANRKALDRALTKGDKIILSNPINVQTNTGVFKREIEYLKQKGYEVSPDGLEMIRK
jgi:hypothetical protein